MTATRAPGAALLVRQLASALRGSGRKVYGFGLHFGFCPYTRGTYDRWDGALARYVPIECSERCAAANKALEAAEAWLMQDALPLEVV